MFSVKDIGLKDTGDLGVGWRRWQRRAIEASADQLYGAARWIGRSPGVVTAAGEPGLSFPDPSHRRVHLIAVALGGRREGPFSQGDFGKGFVHVFDERSLDIVLEELDTVTDFVRYLVDKEAFATQPGIIASDEDLLAVYLSGNRAFPTGCDHFVIDDTCWDGFSRQPEFLAKKEANRQSYLWDYLIELLTHEHKEGYLQPGLPLSEIEQIVRVMAKENRFNRRVLSARLEEFLAQARQGRTRARMVSSTSGVTYVFLRCLRSEPQESRLAELDMRTFVARGSLNEGDTVIGIAVVESNTESGFSLEVLQRHQSVWTTEDAALAAEVQRHTGFFSNPLVTKVHDDEYPRA